VSIVFPSMLAILIGLPRHVLEVKEKARVATVHRQAELIELRNALSKSILELRQSQRIYMPGLSHVLENDETSNETTKLWLPSELSPDDQATWCLPGIPALEFRFRYAQADDSLAEIRRLQRTLQGLHDQNSKHSKGQRPGTRSQGVFSSFEARSRRAVTRYRHARQAMLALDPSQRFRPGWLQRFRVLEDADVRGPGRETKDKSEGKFQLTWIWLVPRQPSNTSNNSVAPTNKSVAPTNKPVTTTNTASGSNVTTSSTSATVTDSEVVDSMRVHWAKCQARADRYEEEVTLTVEEMGRTLRYFEWKKSSWLSLQSIREQSAAPPPTEVCLGLRAYAYRQAHVYETLTTSFVERWRRLLVHHRLGADWLPRYPDATDPLSTKPSRGHFKQRAHNPNLSMQADSAASSSLGPLPDAKVDAELTEEDVEGGNYSDVEGDGYSDDDGEYIVDYEEGFDFDD
jgi:hypothetical protein